MSFEQFRQELTVTPSPGSFVNGYWAETSPTPYTITASVQPANGEQRKNVPEGYDIESALALGTDPANELHVAKRGEVTKKSDQVTFENRLYDVVAREPWKNQVIPHRWYVIALPDNA